MSKTVIKGITWNHPRGYAPLEGDAGHFRKLFPDVEVKWSRRSLSEFGEARLEQYVEDFDLVVLDHPFVGEASAKGLIEPLNSYLQPKYIDQLATDSAGPSFGSYVWEGLLWALPIDAAVQVASYRPDVLAQSELPQSIDQVFTLAERLSATGKFVAVPLCPIDVMCTYLTLLAGAESAPTDASQVLCSVEAGLAALGTLRRLASASIEGSLSLNPIQLYDRMSATDEVVYCPYAFGYVNYSSRGAAKPIAFADVPSVAANGPTGALLGGAGLALSSRSKYKAEAAAYAAWLSAPEYQATRYVSLGGQPGSRTAWLSKACNAATLDYFSNTYATLSRAYVRPRWNGFIEFFDTGSKMLHRAVADNEPDPSTLDALNALYRSCITSRA